MSESIHDELVALSARWRARAIKFMADAERAHRGADVVRLTAMASTLEWAAGDLGVIIDERGAVTLKDEAP